MSSLTIKIFACWFTHIIATLIGHYDDNDFSKYTAQSYANVCRGMFVYEIVGLSSLKTIPLAGIIMWLT